MLMNPSQRRRRLAVAAVLLLGVACSSGGESACSQFRERLDRVEAEMGDEAAQSWDEVMRGQELQQERAELRGEMARRKCE